MTQKKFIAYLDILGFKQLIENNTLEEVKAAYTKMLEDSFSVIKEFKRNVAENSSDGWPTFSLKRKIVSDSIMLWNDNDSIEGFYGLLVIIRGMCSMGLVNSMPLRGAIVYGELDELTIPNQNDNVQDTPVLLGNGLTKAFELEKQLDIMGCVISPEVKEYVDNWLFLNKGTNISNAFKDGSRIISYDVPTKQGLKNYYCINWFSSIAKYFSESDIDYRVEESFSGLNKSIEDEHVQSIIKNTTAFMKYCLLKCPIKM